LIAGGTESPPLQNPLTKPKEKAGGTESAIPIRIGKKRKELPYASGKSKTSRKIKLITAKI